MTGMVTKKGVDNDGILSTIRKGLDAHPACRPDWLLELEDKSV